MPAPAGAGFWPARQSFVAHPSATPLAALVRMASYAGWPAMVAGQFWRWRPALDNGRCCATECGRRRKRSGFVRTRLLYYDRIRRVNRDGTSPPTPGVMAPAPRSNDGFVARQACMSSLADNNNLELTPDGGLLVLAAPGGVLSALLTPASTGAIRWPEHSCSRSQHGAECMCSPAQVVICAPCTR